jgi:hypothetical protein
VKNPVAAKQQAADLDSIFKVTYDFNNLKSLLQQMQKMIAKHDDQIKQNESQLSLTAKR